MKLQQRLLNWFADCLPEGARRRTTIIADREFHSIHLASWIEKTLKLNFVLRIKAGTRVEFLGDWYNAGDFATRGRTQVWESVKVTTDGKATHRVNLVAVWDRDQEEPWLLITNLTDADKVREIYSNRFWIEEMFSDHKSRGLNLESARLRDPDRIERLLVAVTLAYLWIMEVGVFVVTSGQWRQVDNRGASRSVSLCQIGLRWLSERRNLGFFAPFIFSLFQAFGGCLKKTPPIRPHSNLISYPTAPRIFEQKRVWRRVDAFGQTGLVNKATGVPECACRVAIFTQVDFFSS